MRRVWSRWALGFGCVVAALVHSSFACAQSPGLMVGYTGSDQSAQASEYSSVDFEASKHPTVGLLLSFDAGFWRWEPRVNYTFKGREDALLIYFYSGYDVVTVGLYDQLEYLSLQSDFHLKFPVGNANFYALCAPRLDVLLHQESKIGWEENYQSRPATAPQFARYSPTVFGLALGLGQDIQVGRHELFLEARYDWDLEAAWTFQVSPPYHPGYPLNTGPVHNQTLFLQLGIRLWTTEKKREEARWPPADPS